MITSRYPIIWCGDQNMTTNPQIDRIPSRNYNDAYSKDITDLFITFGLVDTCRHLYPNKLIFTFHRNECKSQIDKIMVSNQFDIMKYEQNGFAFSDHDIVDVQLQ